MRFKQKRKSWVRSVLSSRRIVLNSMRGSLPTAPRLTVESGSFLHAISRYAFGGILLFLLLPLILLLAGCPRVVTIPCLQENDVPADMPLPQKPAQMNDGDLATSHRTMYETIVRGNAGNASLRQTVRACRP